MGATEWPHGYPCPDCTYKPLSMTSLSNSFGSILCVLIDGNPRYLVGVSKEKPYSGCNDTNYIVFHANSTSECKWKPSTWIIKPFSNRFYPTGHYSIFIKGKGAGRGEATTKTLKEPIKKYPFYITPAVVFLLIVFALMYWRY